MTAVTLVERGQGTGEGAGGDRDGGMEGQTAEGEAPRGRPTPQFQSFRRSSGVQAAGKLCALGIRFSDFGVEFDCAGGARWVVRTHAGR